MSAFAGLVCRDPSALRVAESAWRSPPGNHAAGVAWSSGPAYLIQWPQASAPMGSTPAPSNGARVLTAGRPNGLTARPSGVASGSSPTPGDVIEAAWRNWGEATPARLEGEFAFAAWDSTREALFLGRDAVGGYPVYYHLSNEGISFATDLSVLLRLPFVPRKLSDDNIVSVLSQDPLRPASATYYEAVSLLPSGHSLRWVDHEAAVRRWWQPSPAEVGDGACEAELRDLVVRAVEDRMSDGRRIAVHLSGGLDSSAVACIAARRLRQEGRRLLAISSVLPEGWSGPETDERRYVEAVLGQEDNIDVHWVELPREASPFEGYDHLFEVLGQPPYSGVSHVERHLGELGRELGVDVVLSGWGGDFFASWGGSGVTQALAREGNWRQAAAELRALHQAGRGSWPRLIKREGVGPLLRWARAHAMGAMGKVAGPHGHRERPDHLHAPDPRGLRHAHPHDQMRVVMAPGRMEVSMNAMVQLSDRDFGQSLRFPLLDRRILEFMLGVPVGELQQGGVGRSLFRRAMRNILPELVRLRPDKGPAFDPLLAARLVEAREGLRTWAEHTAGEPWWDHVDRARFMRELAAIEPTGRGGWRTGMFQHVLVGGMVARFVEWHARQQPHAS